MATQFPSVEEVKIGCKKCESLLEFDFTFAFQPLVDVQRREIFGYEALVRGVNQEGAGHVLSKVDDHNRYAFDQSCRMKAIALAAKLGLDKVLSINFLPNAVYEPEHCIQSTLQTAKICNFPHEKIMFEITESEAVYDLDHLTKIFRYYQKQGFITALDDFGAGHAGLNTLSKFIPNIMKLDINLVRDIHKDSVKQSILKGMLSIAKDLHISLLAEGVETYEEAAYFKHHGVYLMQGFYFAKPGFQSLPRVDLSLDIFA
ncbi:EAL domain-containing protein [Thiomicrorhabdus sediminis]|uniref:EAL domain-containing protein n=1 Tax=Thiomicrorhabdus sediminis TaxID=2580412 RepID=A0A4P9K2Z3_9GAMM|nr:EAL domain-containing protein [Thiomicrorhabdus sediminis]QCU89185.1 EAL domain-containing protein [Thiomicrorhabdus sediminis]